MFFVYIEFIEYNVGICGYYCVELLLRVHIHVNFLGTSGL